MFVRILNKIKFTYLTSKLLKISFNLTSFLKILELSFSLTWLLHIWVKFIWMEFFVSVIKKYQVVLTSKQNLWSRLSFKFTFVSTTEADMPPNKILLSGFSLLVSVVILPVIKTNFISRFGFNLHYQSNSVITNWMGPQNVFVITRTCNNQETNNLTKKQLLSVPFKPEFVITEFVIKL